MESLEEKERKKRRIERCKEEYEKRGSINPETKIYEWMREQRIRNKTEEWEEFEKKYFTEE